MRLLTRETELNLDNGFFAIKFGADWCAPCKKMIPIIEKIENEFGENLTFISADVDEVPTLASRYQIRVVPTLLIIKNGREKKRIAGVVPIGAVRKTIRDLLHDSVLPAHQTADI